MTDRRPGKGAAPADSKETKKPAEEGGGRSTYVILLALLAFGVLSIYGGFAGWEWAGPFAVLFGWIFAIVVVVVGVAFFGEDDGTRWRVFVAGFWLTLLGIGTIQFLFAVLFGMNILY